MTSDEPMTAGVSTCPLCERTWTVTPLNDCVLPACGCYGADTSAFNPARPCHPCGLSHALTCDRAEREADDDG